MSERNLKCPYELLGNWLQSCLLDRPLSWPFLAEFGSGPSRTKSFDSVQTGRSLNTDFEMLWVQPSVGLVKQLSKEGIQRPCMCNTSNPTKIPNGGFDVTGRDHFRRIISLKHISLFLTISLDKTTQKEPNPELEFFKLLQIFSLYFLATSYSFQALFGSKFFSGNPTQNYLNFLFL